MALIARHATSGAVVTVRAAGIDARAQPPIEWRGSLRAEADDAGRWAMEGVPAGIPLLVTARDGRGRHHEARLAPDEPAPPIVSLLQPPAAITVRMVSPRRGAVAGHLVRLRSMDDADTDLCAHSDADGTALFERLRPGRYRVRATDPKEDGRRDDVRARIREVEVAAGETLELQFEAPLVVDVRGTVTTTGRPPSGARIGFGPIGETPDYHIPLLFDVQDGQFSARMPPGSYHVHLSHRSGRVELEAPLVVPAAPQHEVTITLDER